MAHLLASSPWVTRFPPPEVPWTHAYNDTHRGLVSAALDDAELCAAAGAGGRLPAGYGVGLDERVVEYPWLFGQGLAGSVLDAGSTFNHEHILDRALPLVDDLTIVTLEPEAWAYPLRRVSYVFADLRALPFADGQFDIAVSISTLEHIGMDNTMYGVTAQRARIRGRGRPGRGRAAPRGAAGGTDPGHRSVRASRGPRLAASVRRARARAAGRRLRRPRPRDAHVLPLREDRLAALLDHRRARASYRDYTTDPSPVDDLAAAARAVACVAITV